MVRRDDASLNYEFLKFHYNLHNISEQLGLIYKTNFKHTSKKLQYVANLIEILYYDYAT